MVGSNKFSPDTMIEGFPNSHIEKIDDMPSYDTLKTVRDKLKENASSIRSLLGGGMNGHMGAILTAAQYVHIDITAYVAPNNPGQNPVYPPGATGPVIANLNRIHDQDVELWNEYECLTKAIKKQIIAAVDPIYLQGLRNANSGYNNINCPTILEYLFTNYGEIEEDDLDTNELNIKTAWDPSTPWEQVMKRIDACIEIADAGGANFTARQVMNIAYTIVSNTSTFIEELKTWKRRLQANQTWAAFKVYMLLCQRELRKQQKTAKVAGYHAQSAMQAEQERYKETAEALANLATATASDRQAMANLTNTVADLTRQIKQKDDLIANLKKQLKAKDGTTTTTPPSGGGTRPPRPKWVPKDCGSYCFSHGYLVTKDHTSLNCKFPNTIHKQEATRENNMGGNQTGKPT
jgi:uncharacterized coiled-coil protein SlyX